MRDEEHGLRKRGEHLLEPFDGRDVEVIGGLVEDEEVGLHHERARQRHALAQAARKLHDRGVFGKLQAMERGLDAMLQAPAVGGIQGLLQFLHARHEHVVRRPVVRGFHGQRVRHGVIVDE